MKDNQMDEKKSRCSIGVLLFRMQMNVISYFWGGFPFHYVLFPHFFCVCLFTGKGSKLLETAFKYLHVHRYNQLPATKNNT